MLHDGFFLSLQAVVESVTSAFEYSDLQIDEGKAVSPDMLFDKNKEFLYVMTERRVSNCDY